MQVLLVEADVNNAPTPDGLWNEILEAEKSIRARFPMELVRHRPAIDATREAYKRLGTGLLPSLISLILYPF